MLREEDIRMDWYRDAAPPESHRMSLVRVTHLPSGLWAECGEYRGWIKNKLEALRKLDLLVTEWEAGRQSNGQAA